MATHAHVVIETANPYLTCDVCHKQVRGFVSTEGQVSSCLHHGENVPCGHLPVTSICPSWGPVDGCRCKKQFGVVSHSIMTLYKEPEYE